MRLTAPFVTSKDNTSFAGGVVKADGTFTPVTVEQSAKDLKQLTVTVRAGSAAVITLY